MPQVFHLNSLTMKRFRLFESVSVAGFKRINIVGGSNGVGKSSFLDAAFHLADRLNPATLFRPFEWRGIALAAGDHPYSFREIFRNQDPQAGPIEFSAATTMGEFTIAYALGQSPNSGPMVASLRKTEAGGSSADSYTSGGRDGFTITGTHNGKEDIKCSAQFAGEGLTVQFSTQKASSMPKCMILNGVTRRLPADVATRFSNCIRNNQESLLYQFIHLVHPQIDKLTLLQLGGQATIYADLGENKLVPVPFLGEGASNLLNLALAFLDVEGGILFLDEMDSVVHHSLLLDMWKLIYRMSKRMKVQVFSTTHSEESLEAAVQAASAEKSLTELSYVRLRRDKTGNIAPVQYTGKKLQSSLSESWEVR